VSKGLLLTLVMVTVVALPASAASAGSGSIVFRCGANICRVQPDGSGRTQLTTDGHPGGPAYGWLSATRNGSRLGVAFGNQAYVLTSAGKRVTGPLRKSGAVLVALIRPEGGQMATIEQIAEILHPPPPSVEVHVVTPFLFLAGVSGAGRSTVARSTTTAGWLGGLLMRTERSGTAPYEQQICVLATNTGFECARTVAADPGHDLWGPVASPDGRFVAATRAPTKQMTGEIAVYDAATGALVRSVTTGAHDSQPSWSPDGKQLAFTRGGSLYVVAATGGTARKIAAGVQPVWVR
jgi:hypothetical protein